MAMGYRELESRGEHEVRLVCHPVVLRDVEPAVGAEGVVVVPERRGVEGYALVFNEESEDLGFREVILPGALDGVIERSDVKALLNHDIRKGVLARRRPDGQGSLVLEVTTKGLRYAFEAPRWGLGEELLENLRRGEIWQSSFAFTVAEEQWEWLGDEKMNVGYWKRTIVRFNELFDVSPVYDPAYVQTSVYLRGRDDLAGRGKAGKGAGGTAGAGDAALGEVERYAALFSININH
jgi:HK97 family phage prohead protease